MKLTKNRVLVLGTIAIIIAICCALCAGCADRSGWNTKDGAVRYLDSKGKPQTGWMQIEGKDYYFAPEDGAMVTGWHTVDGARYYFAEDGIRCVGWLQLDENRYYLGEDGTMVTGWQELDGNRYYLGDDGAMVTGWQELDGKRHYFAQDGHAVSGAVVMDGTCYLFQEDGSVTTGWYEDDTGRYFFGEDGKPHTGWLEWEQKTYYLNENGSVTTGWMTLGEDRYYFLPTGRMAIGEVEVDGISRFFTSKGKEVLVCNPWNAIPDDYQLDLVEIEGFKVDADAKEPLHQMLSACRATGIDITINNIYRSTETQQWKWDTRVAERMAQGMTREEAEAKTGESLAIPGHSEHESGLALDINGAEAEYTWMAKNCWDYGFILRYPDDHMEITGIIYEPWHFRYVGTELALELKEYCCMEEYMAMLTQQQKEIAD